MRQYGKIILFSNYQYSPMTVQPWTEELFKYFASNLENSRTSWWIEVRQITSKLRYEFTQVKDQNYSLEKSSHSGQKLLPKISKIGN